MNLTDNNTEAQLEAITNIYIHTYNTYIYSEFSGQPEIIRKRERGRGREREFVFVCVCVQQNPEANV